MKSRISFRVFGGPSFSSDTIGRDPVGLQPLRKLSYSPSATQRANVGARFSASLVAFITLLLLVAGCKAKADSSAQPNAKDAPFMSAVTTAPPPPQIAPADQAPPP